MAKITCGQHRTLGYAFVNGQSVCRGCKMPERDHETSAETVTRRKAEAAQERLARLTSM